MGNQLCKLSWLQGHQRSKGHQFLTSLKSCYIAFNPTSKAIDKHYVYFSPLILYKKATCKHLDHPMCSLIS